MPSTSRIAELASVIQAKTTIVDEFITTNGLPSPSFTVGTPPILQLPEPIAQAQAAALEAMDELQALLLGPMPMIFHEITQRRTNLVSLHAISRFNMATSFPLTETSSVEQIAKSCGLHEDDARRIVRHALTNRLFTEPTKGVIAHSAATGAIAQVPLLRGWIEESCENMWASSPRIVDAMAKWPGSEEPNETAFNIAKHTPDPFFVEISKTGNAKRFADAMSFFQAGPGMETSIIVDNFDWASYQSGVVVDVGGSHGVIALELAKKFPKIQCVVQDLPEVITAAPKLPADDAERVKFEAYDFFTEQTVKDADVYLFRMIFHNWGDKYSVRILRNLIPALKKGARIVINDHVVPEPGVLPHYQERSVRSFDLTMKEMFNAKERDVNDWTSLLEKADPRFKVAAVTRPTGSQLQIIEAVWDEVGTA